MELDIVTIFRDRKTFERFFYLTKEEQFTREIWNILKSFDTYYKSKPELDTIDILDFAAWFRFVTPHCVNPSQAALYNKIFSKLHSHICDTKNVETVMKLFLEQDYASKIQDISLGIISKNGRDSIEDVVTLVSKYSTEASKFDVEDVSLVTTDILKLLDATVSGAGLN